MGKMRDINIIQVYLANDSIHKLPKSISIEYLDGAEWKQLKSFTDSEVSEQIRFNSKDDISTRKIRILVVEEPGMASGIYEVEAMKYVEKSDPDPDPDPDPKPDPKPIPGAGSGTDGDTGLKETVSATKEELELQLKSNGFATIDTLYGSIIIPEETYKIINLKLGEKLDIEIKPSGESIDGVLVSYDFTFNVGERKIESFGDNGVLISMLCKNNLSQREQALVGAFIDKIGKVHVMPLSYYDKVQQKIMISTTHSGKFGIMYNFKTFKDTSKHWAEDYITFLAAREIVKGMDEKIFAPNKSITRAEFVKMLSGIVGVDLNKYGNNGFNDVNTNDWYSTAVAWAVQNKIASGYGNGNFGPKDNITREQMAVIIANFVKVMQYQLAEIKDEISFDDADSISGYAKEAVKSLQMSGIISGKGNNIFDPQGNATRAEAAKIIAEIIAGMVQGR